ncbi:hypothetical protein LZ31DRAFT_265996 [Colletotrichum somersetense]|nr:hypothetical protein LZ31DRAFT_265996 [Colletotrichum somersetense]
MDGWMRTKCVSSGVSGVPHPVSASGQLHHFHMRHAGRQAGRQAGRHASRQRTLKRSSRVEFSNQGPPPFVSHDNSPLFDTEERESNHLNSGVGRPRTQIPISYRTTQRCPIELPCSDPSGLGIHPSSPSQPRGSYCRGKGSMLEGLNEMVAQAIETACDGFLFQLFEKDGSSYTARDAAAGAEAGCE